jgi:hypothetical protein
MRLARALLPRITMMRTTGLFLLVAMTLQTTAAHATPDLELSSKLAASAASEKTAGKTLLVIAGVLGAGALASGLTFVLGACRDPSEPRCPIGGVVMVFAGAGAGLFGTVGAIVYGLGAADEQRAKELGAQITPVATPSGGGLMLSARF